MNPDPARESRPLESAGAAQHGCIPRPWGLQERRIHPKTCLGPEIINMPVQRLFQPAVPGNSLLEVALGTASIGVNTGGKVKIPNLPTVMVALCDRCSQST